MIQYNNLLENRLVKGKILFDSEKIIHFVPDFNTNILDYIDDFLFQIQRINGITIKTNMFKVGTVQLNPKKYYIDVKSQFPKTYNIVPNKLPTNKIQIIDHSVIIQGIEKFIRRNPKSGFFYLFNYLKNEFQFAKNQNKEIENIAVFNFKNTGMFELMGTALKQLSKNSELFTFFDNKLIASCDSTSVVFGYYNKTLEINPQAFLKLKSVVEGFQSISKTPDETIEIPEIVKINKNNIRNLIDSKKIKDLDHNELEKSFGKTSINNPIIEKNIEIALNNNISKNASQEKINETILKTLNKTIYNSEELSTADINNPEKLLKKIKIYENEYKVDINFQNNKNKDFNLIKPSRDIIKLDDATGPIRHQFEFSDQVHQHVEKLFSTLEEKNLPIEIVDFKHEVKDNNLDRFIEYTITLKNKAAGSKNPYTVKLKVPDVLNGKYFKLNGKEYILSSQQFLKPITKSTPTEARFLSHYNMITQRVVNFKYSPSDITSIIAHIRQKYSNQIVKSDKHSIEFKNGQIIDLNSKAPYIGPNENLEFRNGYYKLTKDGVLLEKTFKKNEFIYDKLYGIINSLDPKDELKNSSRSLQYVDIYVMGKYVPLIFALWQQLGLIDSLMKLGIDFEITDNLEGIKSPNNVFELKDDKFLVIFPDSKRQEYIINGLYKLDILKTIYSKDLNNPKSCQEAIVETYGNKIINNLNTMVEISIDPTTKELLELEDMPTNIIDIISGPLLDTLFNAEPDHPSDLSTLRVRLSEYLTHIVYTEIAMAYRTYKDKLAYDNDSKLFLDENYIIKNLLNQHAHSEATGSSLIDYIEPYSPVDELIKSSKVVRTGAGGVPSKQAFRKEHRNIHESYIGNISAHSTTESTDVGLVNYHTLGAFISSTNGMYGFKMRDGENNNWDSVSIDEALIPFQNSMNSDRLIIARTHMGQKTPILNGQPPLVQSGAEHVVPKIVSEKFAISAKQDGSIIELDEGKFITVKYKDGSTETFDIMPRTSATKRNTIISISLDTLKLGDSFQAGNLLAWNKAFKNEILSIGQNKIVAILNYMGKSHEDGYVISEKFQNSFITETVIKIPVIIPLGTKIIFFNKDKETSLNDPLIKFQYDNEVSIDDYLDDFNILDKDNDNVSGEDETDNENLEGFYRQNNNIFEIKSPGGKVIDIKIKLNTKTNIDKTLVTEWKKQNDKIKIIQQKTGKQLLDNIDTSITRIGTHKLKGVEFEGGLIEFYIDTKKNIKLGDKIANRFGAKGVINHIIPESNTPRGEYSGLIDTFIAPNSVVGRKNTVIIKELYIGKILFNLKNIIKDELESNGFESAKKKLLYVYDTLDPSKLNSDSISNLTETNLKNILNNPDGQLNIIVPPFGSVSFKNIKVVANKLKIPLDERVYIPEIDNWSDPVPVGYAYISTMEQLASDYESTRARAGYNPVTGQPLKRKSKIGGQALGNLDTYNLLTYDCNNMMKEFYTARSDNFKAKNEMVSNIINNGSTNVPEITNKGRTQELFKTMMLSMGLFVKE